MKTQLNPPRKKTPRKGPDPSEKNRPAPSDQETRQGSGANSAPEPVETPSKEEVVSNWSKPVTNQDEQDKITNAGEGDIPIANK
jgi:hypothetical protein